MSLSCHATTDHNYTDENKKTNYAAKETPHQFLFKFFSSLWTFFLYPRINYNLARLTRNICLSWLSLVPSGPLKGQNVDNKAREEVKFCITHFPAMFEHSIIQDHRTSHVTLFSSVNILSNWPKLGVWKCKYECFTSWTVGHNCSNCSLSDLT